MNTKTDDGIIFFSKKSLDYFKDKPANGDNFFREYGVGNATKFVLQPYERHKEYESILLEMKKVDLCKFEAVHKGIAYYFLAWTAYDMENFGKSMFYMDATISEDINKDPKNWKKNPMYLDLTLDTAGGGVAQRLKDGIKKVVHRDIGLYKNCFNCSVNEKYLITQFVDDLIMSDEKRSIMTSLFSFMLEYESMRSLLTIRSAFGGSIEPFLLYLFKGGLLFESLLKHYNITKPEDNSIGKILRNNKNIRDKYKCNDIETSANIFSDIINYPSKTNNVDNHFNITGKIRNFTGHDLSRYDELNLSVFEKLYEKIISSIFYLIENK